MNKIKEFNKKYKVIQPFNITPKIDDTLLESDINTRGLKQYSKSQNQFRRNKICYVKSITSSYSLVGTFSGGLSSHVLTFDSEEGNKNKLKSIFDNGREIRKPGRYEMQITLPFEFSNNVSSIEVVLERIEPDATSHIIGTDYIEMDSTKDIADYFDAITLKANAMDQFNICDKAQVTVYVKSTSSGAGVISVGNKRAFFTLQSLSY